MTTSQSATAKTAIKLVQMLQAQLANAMEQLNASNKAFVPVSWKRDEGTHGGGTRLVSTGNKMFNRASVNFSHVHYDDMPEKKLASASALSAIIHPDNPHCPSAHFHFSWTEMRDGTGYWRLMADLNPSIPNENDKTLFNEALTNCTGEHDGKGKENGDAYFYIPALKKHRGVSHFYLEGYNSGDFQADCEYVKSVAGHMIETYATILSKALNRHTTYSEEEKAAQIDYHTLYLYQVLTLDKGTIAGILVHNQNDLGVFGSLPAVVNGELIHSWIDKTPAPFNELVAEIGVVLTNSNQARVEDEQKTAFAKIIREFYQKHPQQANFKTVASR